MIKGEIVLISFPFTDFSSSKYRPAVVISEHKLDLILCFITSNLSWQEETDMLITPNKINGLKRTSLVRVSKIITLEKSLAKGILGKLTNSEILELNEKLKIALIL
ncbi:MAG: type II toxin-antitoxin system PemK/MazF family toxin [Bacteroidia bacterium]|nr:type II toxin-antitoxin system PemK/MazF family toxin [Bacteroidia bacterium]